jgi:hypothetical protein
MKKHITLLVLVIVTATTAFPQKVGPYKITAIHVTPFNEVTGRFDAEMAKDDTGGFWNDLSKSVLAVIEITGPPEEYATKRNVSIRVTEGRKLKLARIAYPGVLGTDGKYYVPVWLYGSMCSPVTISATITGQPTASSMKRILGFMCGE